jgi:hypothetical protein
LGDLVSVGAVIRGGRAGRARSAGAPAEVAPLSAGCWPQSGASAGKVLSDAPVSKGRSRSTGKIFQAVPECAVLLERGAQLLGSRVIALPGG